MELLSNITYIFVRQCTLSFRENDDKHVSVLIKIQNILFSRYDDFRLNAIRSGLGCVRSFLALCNIFFVNEMIFFH